MIREYLQLVFKNEEGRNFTLTVYDPKENLTEAEVTETMDQVIATNLFASNGGELKSKVSARVVNREVTPVVDF